MSTYNLKDLVILLLSLSIQRCNWHKIQILPGEETQLVCENGSLRRWAPYALGAVALDHLTEGGGGGGTGIRDQQTQKMQ